MENTIEKLNFGDVVYVDFGEIDGITHCQRGLRPAVVLTNKSILEHGNAPIIQVIPISTSNKHKKFHVYLDEEVLSKTSFAMPEQVTTVDLNKVLNIKGHLSETSLLKIKKAVYKQMALDL